MGNLTYTVSGDVASFRSAARVPIESLKCHFLPKQDLHGYDKPWPAGSGKNLFDVNTPIEYGFYYTATGEFSNSQNRIITDYISIDYNVTYTIKINSNIDNLVLINYNLFDENKVWLCARDGNSDTNFNGDLVHTFTINVSNAKYIRIVIRDSSEGSITNKTLQNSKLQFEVGSTASTYEPYENICPITGWNACTAYKANKNIGHIIGFSASAQAAHNRILTNTYGTTIDTINFNGPNGAVVITQSQTPQTSNIPHYQNGYMDFYPDNLIWDQKYNISFKVSNITANPLNTTINNFKLINPYGSQYGPSKVEENIVYYNNVIYKQREDRPEITCFDIRICGMSCTISDFIITSADIENDGVWEPYYGDIIPITFPITGKNKFNWNVEFVNPDVTTSTSASKRIFQPYTYCIGGSYSNYFMPIAVESYNIENGTISVKRKTGYSVYGVSYALPLIGGQTYYLSCTAVSGFIHTAFYDEKGNYLTGSSNNYSNFSFTVPDNATIGVFNFIPSNTTDTATFSNIQIELGNTATEYIEFSGNNTVYGGYIDIAKGELIQTWSSINLGDLTWAIVTNANNISYFRAFKQMPPTWRPNVSVAQENSHPAHMIADRFQNCAAASIYADTAADDSIAVEWTNPGSIRLKYTACNLDVETLMPKLQNALLYYELETPITYYLSKIELKTFLDKNNLWSNTNDITEVSYQIHDSNMIKEAKKNMIAENDKHYQKVIWNNIANGYCNSNDWVDRIADDSTTTFEDGIATTAYHPTGGVTIPSFRTARINDWPQVYTSHKYYAAAEFYPVGADLALGFECAGGHQYSKMMKADTWTHYAIIVSGKRNGTGTMYAPFCTSSGSGMTAKIKNVLYVDLTLMFGEGNEPTIPEEFEALCTYNEINLTIPQSRNVTGTTIVWKCPYKTVTWNQWGRPLTDAYYKSQNSDYTSLTFGVYEITRTMIADSTQVYQTSIINRSSNASLPCNSSHKYYQRSEIYSSNNHRYEAIFGSGDWRYYVYAVPNTWTVLEGISYPSVTYSGGSGSYLAYDRDNAIIGETCTVRNFMYIDLTQMFGEGKEPSLSEFKRLCTLNGLDLSTYHDYNTGTSIRWIT